MHLVSRFLYSYENIAIYYFSISLQVHVLRRKHCHLLVFQACIVHASTLQRQGVLQSHAIQQVQFTNLDYLIHLDSKKTVSRNI